MAWYLLISLLSSASSLDADRTQQVLATYSLAALNTWLRVVAHLGLFGVLAILVQAARGTWPPRLPDAWATLVLVGLLALIDEAHQGVVPGRAFRLPDAGLDVLGAVLALTVSARLCRPAGHYTGAER